MNKTRYSKLHREDAIGETSVDELFNDSSLLREDGGGEVELSAINDKEDTSIDDLQDEEDVNNNFLHANTQEDDDIAIILPKDKERAAREQLQLRRLDNLAVPMSYFMVGLVQGIVYPLLNVYPLDLGATEAQQSTIWFVKGLPSCLKIIFGFLSDNLPIAGYRRKPYMLIGWMISIVSMVSLLLLSDMTLESVDVLNGTNTSTFSAGLEESDQVNNNLNITATMTTKTNIIIPENAPSVLLLSIAFFVWGMGVWMADVMGDSLVAEKAKFETNVNRGNLQAVCYILRGFGTILVSPFSTLAYNITPNGPRLIILAAIIFPLLMVPFIYKLKERRIIVPEKNTREQVQELWRTACSRAVWQPMGFIYIYVVMFVSNSAWREFVKSVLDFTSNQLNVLMIMTGVLTFGGIILYKFVLISWSWRSIFIIGISLNAIFSLLQILLIQKKTFGLDPFLFAMGDDAVMEFILGVQYLPMCVMMVNLVPTGIEGASYALFTTTWNAASALSDAFSTMLLGIWDVSKEALVAGKLTGLTKLTVLTTILQLIPLLFVGFMPHSVDDLNRLKSSASASSSSQIGGAAYLSIVFFSVSLAVFIGAMNVIRPGWMGES